jgi:ABC-2 type transport system ATP-binding protein
MTQENSLALDINSIAVSYGKKNVLEDYSLQVQAGETFGLMGLNGAGKTTLIKSILGLRQLKAGEISIYGAPHENAKSRKVLAYLPERFDPPMFLSGLEFVSFSLSLYGTSFKKEQAYEFAEKLALDPNVLKNRVQTYSKGMRQKLGLMATIMTDCPLLILDEPMSGLDPLARAYLKDVLRDVREKGRTIFLSSHVLADMNEICDRVSVLHDGKMEYLGTPSQMLVVADNENIERAFLNIIGNS